MKLASLSDAFLFFKTITFSKIWNGFLLRFSYFFSFISGKSIHWGFPEFLSIEPVNLCNLHCPECPTGNNQLTRNKTYFSLPAYIQLIEQTKRHLSFLQLYFQGEPFLHPKIFDFIKIAVNQKIYTATSTNGHYLTIENCHRIIDSGLHRLIISMDGTTQETYGMYRVGGSLETVIQGLKNLQSAKKERKSNYPFTILQFVVFKNNEHQLNEIRQLAKELKVNQLVLKSAQLENYKQGNPLMTSLEKYNRYKKSATGTWKIKRKNNFKCRRIWKGAVISATQDVLPCCFDKNANHAYGNLSTDSLAGLTTGKTLHQLRQWVWGAPENRPHMCDNCTEGMGSTWFS